MKKLRLVLDIEYDENGVPVDTLKHLLSAIPLRAAGDGAFTGSTPAEVETWSYSIKEMTAEMPTSERKPRILVVVNRGLCEEVVTETPAEVLVRDMDEGCGDPDDMVRDHIEDSNVDPERVNQVFEE